MPSFMFRPIPSLIACLVILLITPLIDAQEPEATSHLFEDRLLPMLFNEDVQPELDLVNDQKLELTRLLDDLKKQKEQLGIELREFSSVASQREVELTRQAMTKEFDEQKKKAQEAMMDILLPHQQVRLRQMTAQVMIRELARRKRLPSGILAPEIVEFLEIKDEQISDIEKKATAIQKRLAEQIRKLTEEAETELLNELTPKQKAKYKKLVGDPIQKPIR